MIPKIQFIPLGGALEVGANSYYINWDNKVSILLDCGTKGDGPTFEGLPDFTKADSKVDYIVISHAHNDHIGGLPFAQRYFLKKNGKIITTPETAEIAGHVLRDSGKIMAVKEEEKKNPIFSKTVRSLYSEENVENSVNGIVKLEYGKEFELKDGIKLVLFDASHVHGSACV
ncbi:MAG: MBL fold metallo-hydrolase, partial [Elusimicrobiales bacterium]|nr:MBL fold metallo-hydrolase [Elusimicrobiales bacterium]